MTIGFLGTFVPSNQNRIPVELPAALLSLLEQPSPCYFATTMRDGSPQLTQTWVDTDGVNILINTVQGYQKVKNIHRDPRVALTVSDPADSSRYFSVRGRVLSVSEDGAAEHIEKLAQRYLGGPYPWFGGRGQQRLIVTVEPRRISGMG